MSRPVNQKLSILFLPTPNVLLEGLESIVFEQGQRMLKMPAPSVLAFKSVVVVGSLDTLQGRARKDLM
jgi:hypothetical protein